MAGALLGVGVLFWLINYLAVGGVNFDPTHVDDSRDRPRNPAP